MKKLHHKIGAAFQQLAQTIATKLGNRINPLSSRAKKRGVIVTGLFIGVTCILLILHSFSNNMFTRYWPQDSIARPVDVFPVDTVDSEAEIIRQYNTMFEFKDLLTALDSLDACQTSDSMPNYQSITDY
ncbi:MAG: hypothetical protein J0L67_04295 [Cytophagales bacterium]|nr:hypothetical protein [Cytophagales bacterium]